MHFGEYSYLGVSKRTNLIAIHGHPANDYYPCKDGYMSIVPGIGGAPNIPLLMEVPELQDDPLFAKPGARIAEPEKFDALVLPWLKKQEKWKAAKAAQEITLAFTPVLTPGELQEDEQLRAREFFAKTNHPVMGEVTYAGAPAKLSETRWRPGTAPLLGEHNEEIYGELGYSKEDLVRLREQGFI
jgi:formyl-CoA transferase